MKKWLLLAAAVAGLAVVWLAARRTTPPEVRFERVKRERLVSTLATNGKAEPIEWSRVRAERAGAVRRVAVEQGAEVARGAVLAELDTEAARAGLAAAEARLVQARAEIETLDRGGRASERADIEGQMASARLELEQAEKEAGALARLAGKNAATRQDAAGARDRAAKAQALVRALELRRAALVTPADRGAAEARLREAQAAAGLARQALELGAIRSPLAGVVYNLAVRAGAYVNPGDEIAQVGRIGRLRIVVYVDEPELGRVARGMPVTITWDALPGREWKGEVEKIPSSVAPLGTREVGEVRCVVDNPERALPPGANINASILSRVVDNALTIPKEALRREGAETGVYVLEGTRLAWRAVRTGVSSVTRIEAVEGLREGDAVALATETALRPNLEVLVR